MLCVWGGGLLFWRASIGICCANEHMMRGRREPFWLSQACGEKVWLHDILVSDCNLYLYTHNYSLYGCLQACMAVVGYMMVCVPSIQN